MKQIILIEKNVFNHSQLLLDDGGALYINANNQTIRNNFFLNSFGNRDFSSGLYNGSNFVSWEWAYSHRAASVVVS